MPAPSEDFDPYYQWLGISPSERPCDHYRLLGLPRFEEDLARVVAAAEARMTLVRSYQVGPRGRYTQRVLNELSAAKVCLTTPAAKAAYDESLRVRDLPVAAAAAMMSLPVPPPVAPPLAPPVLPPPLASRLPTLEIDSGESDEHEPDSQFAEPGPWWRPMVGLVGAALLVLAGVTVWAITAGLNRPSASAVVNLPESPDDLPPDPSPPEPLAIVQQQEASGEIRLALTTAELTGGVELVEADAGPELRNWQAEDARSTWQIALVEPGFFQVELVYATTAGIADSSLQVTVGEQTKRCSLRDSGGLDTFLTDSYTIALRKSGKHTLVLESSTLPAAGDLVVRSVRLVPVGGSAPAER
jgi:hypothetical protein